jgi:hypothetical protein
MKKTITLINKLLEGVALNSNIYCPRRIIHKDIIHSKYFCNENFLEMINPFGAESNTGIEKHSMNKYTPKVVRHLVEGDELTFETELIINAEDFNLFQNHRLACVEIQSAVEYFMAYFLRKKLKELGKDEQYISDLLRGRLDDWKTGFNEIDKNFVSSTEWTKWKQDCYLLRNKVIHKAYSPSETEAKNALEAGKQIMNYLKLKI